MEKVEYNRRQNSTVVGTGELSTLKSSIKAVPSVTYYHVFNLHPTILCENIIDFLKQDFPEVTCSQLTSSTMHLLKSVMRRSGVCIFVRDGLGYKIVNVSKYVIERIAEFCAFEILPSK
nr:unnamed protein product [Callosobruchus chinensis]